MCMCACVCVCVCVCVRVCLCEEIRMLNTYINYINVQVPMFLLCVCARLCIHRAHLT